MQPAFRASPNRPTSPSKATTGPPRHWSESTCLWPRKLTGAKFTLGARIGEIQAHRSGNRLHRLVQKDDTFHFMVDFTRVVAHGQRPSPWRQPSGLTKKIGSTGGVLPSSMACFAKVRMVHHIAMHRWVGVVHQQRDAQG